MRYAGVTGSRSRGLNYRSTEIRELFARIHTVLAWIIFAGGFGLIYLIGLSVFGGASPDTHGAFGRYLFLASLVMLLAALIARGGRLSLGLSVLVPLLFLLQGVFVYLPAFPPVIRALHALNGLVIMGLSYLLANGRGRAMLPAHPVAVAGQHSTD